VKCYLIIQFQQLTLLMDESLCQVLVVDQAAMTHSVTFLTLMVSKNSWRVTLFPAPNTAIQPPMPLKFVAYAMTLGFLAK
jgi:hypothetical protein